MLASRLHGSLRPVHRKMRKNTLKRRLESGSKKGSICFRAAKNVNQLLKGIHCFCLLSDDDNVFS